MLSYEEVSNKGERVLLGDSPRMLSEHRARYYFATHYVRPGHVVIDCACGSGYGCAVLAGKGQSVTGVDISLVAIDYCQKNYLAPNINFLQGAAEKLPFKENACDVFCSFETIEHVPAPEKLVQEAYRVLRVGGCFLVSTPNRVWTGLESGEKPPNPFHLAEWSLGEFDGILRSCFCNIQYFGQRIRSANKLHPKYVRSRFLRLLGQPDFVALPATHAQLLQLETPRWCPENFLAVCWK